MFLDIRLNEFNKSFPLLQYCFINFSSTFKIVARVIDITRFHIGDIAITIPTLLRLFLT